MLSTTKAVVMELRDDRSERHKICGMCWIWQLIVEERSGGEGRNEI